MFNSKLANDIHELIPSLRLREGEPMSAHCSFRIGGPAELFAEPASERELVRLVSVLRYEAVPFLVIGNGTNLLVTDSGVRGVVIHLGEGFAGAQAEENRILAQGGITLARLAVLAMEHSLAGLEFAHGIPGSLGGAVVMNAGAYGGELKDVIKSVRVLCPDGGVRTFAAQDCDFSYRHSRFDEGYIILGAEIELSHGEKGEISARMRELMSRRSASQPLDRPSAGSTFKRPAAGYAAAMIDEAGLKGYRIGGAAVSEKHAGFVVNLGGASFDDVIAVMDHVQKTVLGLTGTMLEPEVRIIRG